MMTHKATYLSLFSYIEGNNYSGMRVNDTDKITLAGAQRSWLHAHKDVL